MATSSVSSITVWPPVGVLGVGSVLTLSLHLNMPVTVTGGVPTLSLNDGATATYTGGSGTNTLTFSYTVALGENTADLQVTGLVANGAAIGAADLGFSSGATYSTGNATPGATPYQAVVGDVNGDGKLDVVTANNISAGGVSILLGNGNGTLGAATNISIGPNNPRTLNIVDLNEDHNPDLLVSAAPGGLAVLLGDGTGGFGPATTYPAGDYPIVVTTADVNGDGKTDAIVVDYEGGTVAVLTGDGAGVLGTATLYNVGFHPYWATTADVNKDGKPDVIVSNIGGGVSVLLNNGSGGFLPAVTYSAGPLPGWVEIADLNGDGNLDLVVANVVTNGGVDVLLGDGQGGFGAATVYAGGPIPSSGAIADVNSDGRPDLILANSYTNDVTPNGIQVLLGDGIGGFNSAMTLPVASDALSITAADLNGDGRPDLVYTDSQNEVGILLNTSTAQSTFDTTTVATATGHNTGLMVYTSGPVPCFTHGTRILTSAGEVAVQALKVGDLVVTHCGATVPVKWLGHRRLDCRRHPRPWDVWPVLVRAGAFGNRRPLRDLRLSPDHSVCVDGVLIPVRYLVNDATIIRERTGLVTYWHVELDQHDVLFAEGLPAESYLDTGNRSGFENGSTVVQAHPDFALRVWEREACAPLVVSGRLLAAAKVHLLEHASVLGHTTTNDPDLRLMVDGRLMLPTRDGGNYRFAVPSGARAGRLISRCFVPAQMFPDSADHRKLGVALSTLRFDGCEILAGDPRRTDGWHAAEPGMRWTCGDAGLVLAGAEELAFDVILTGTYWRSRPTRYNADGEGRVRLGT
ncbi:MAG: FG-GAP-like repeat-containing protein [Alphaproteobacteria bacterium]|nr:FG-GAP-like repeat-containing protein [Alphaproteobacteria bacterium]